MRLGRIVVSNYVGLGWASIMSLAFVPLYVNLLGVESLGMIGIYTLIQSWLRLLDAGIRPMLSREMARWKSGALSVSAARNLLRSAEIIILAVSMAFIVAMFALSGVVARNWLKAETLDPGVIHRALILMGFVVALRFFEAVYRSALIGLREQIWLSYATAILATLRYGGAVAILIFVSRTIDAFFIWQGIISVISLALFATRSWHALPGGQSRARFSIIALDDVKHFAGGMLLINLLVLLSNQTDKIILSGLVSLKDFGYYVLATTGASLIYILTTPIAQAVYPALVEALGTNDRARLGRTYHSACQVLSALLAPLGISLIAFSNPVLFVWSGQADLSKTTAPVLALLAAGYLINALLQLPFYLQLASGRTRVLVYCFALTVACTIPALLWVVPRYGTVGAAVVWLAFQGISLIVIVPLVHRTILHGRNRDWLVNDILLPFSGPLLLLPVAMYFSASENWTRIHAFFFLGVFVTFGYATMLVTCRPLRNRTRSMLTIMWQTARRNGVETR